MAEATEKVTERKTVAARKDLWRLTPCPPLTPCSLVLPSPQNAPGPEGLHCYLCHLCALRCLICLFFSVLSVSLW